jgi:hypothetical protein
VFVSTIGATDPIRGTLVRLDGRSLVLLVDGQPRQVPFDEVLEIDVPRRRVLRGFVIGSVVGGLFSAIFAREAFENSGQTILAVALDAGYFGLFGAGINAMHEGQAPIYVKPPATALPGALSASVGVHFRF